MQPKCATIIFLMVKVWIMA